MKRTLLRIWKDVSYGRNIVDYVLILAAFILPVLNIFKIVHNEQIVWLILPTLGILVVKAVSNTWHEASEVRIHEDWSDEVYEALEKARKSVVVLTSWVVDATVLADKIFAASAHVGSVIRVEIYMLDPDKPFGANRYGEVYDAEKEHEREWTEAYRKHFDTAVMHFRHRLSKGNVSLNLYTYPTMPNVKICVVDDQKFFFSWLPTDEASTKNVCFELSANSTNTEVRSAVARLREHLDALRKKSIDIKTTLKPMPSLAPTEPQTE